MTIAQELEDRMWYLADPATRWVNGLPVNSQSCLLYDGPSLGMSRDAANWLRTFFYATEDVDPVGFNDAPGRTRDDVIERLQEAVDQARWEGV